MKMHSFWAGLFAIVLMGLATPQIAHAQATRTWVSGVGDDANPCSRTAPCKTFAGAISKTAPAGEINVLDPGGFGAVTITKSITIRSDHVEAGVLVSGTNGIVINAAATDTVVLEGLDIDGVGAGLNGVQILGGNTVYVLRCAIRRFSQSGVNVNSSTSGIRVVIQDSVINFNATGVNVQGAGGATMIMNTTIFANSSVGIQVTGAGNIVGMTNSTDFGSPTGISNTGGAAFSFGPSNIISPPGGITGTNPFQ
jgi:hypothetical protein